MSDHSEAQCPSFANDVSSLAADFHAYVCTRVSNYNHNRKAKSPHTSKLSRSHRRHVSEDSESTDYSGHPACGDATEEEDEIEDVSTHSEPEPSNEPRSHTDTQRSIRSKEMPPQVAPVAPMLPRRSPMGNSPGKLKPEPFPRTNAKLARHCEQQKKAKIDQSDQGIRNAATFDFVAPGPSRTDSTGMPTQEPSESVSRSYEPSSQPTRDSLKRTATEEAHGSSSKKGKTRLPVRLPKPSCIVKLKLIRAKVTRGADRGPVPQQSPVSDYLPELDEITLNASATPVRRDSNEADQSGQPQAEHRQPAINYQHTTDSMKEAVKATRGGTNKSGSPPVELADVDSVDDTTQASVGAQPLPSPREATQQQDIIRFRKLYPVEAHHMTDEQIVVGLQFSALLGRKRDASIKNAAGHNLHPTSDHTGEHTPALQSIASQETGNASLQFIRSPGAFSDGTRPLIGHPSSDPPTDGMSRLPVDVGKSPGHTQSSIRAAGPDAVEMHVAAAAVGPPEERLAKINSDSAPQDIASGEISTSNAIEDSNRSRYAENNQLLQDIRMDSTAEREDGTKLERMGEFTLEDIHTGRDFFEALEEEFGRALKSYEEFSQVRITQIGGLVIDEVATEFWLSKWSRKNRNWENMLSGLRRVSARERGPIAISLKANVLVERKPDMKG